MNDDVDNEKTEDGSTDGSPQKEIKAMMDVSNALDGLNGNQVGRVLSWANNFYLGKASIHSTESNADSGADSDSLENDSNDMDFATFDELYAAVDPSDHATRALTAGYWFQVVKSQESFDGYSVNSLLKDHGENVPNVTVAFTSLISRKPRLAMQAGKLGKKKKAYKLTTAGIKAIRRSAKDGIEQD